MAKQKIVITVAPDAQTKIEPVGYTGSSCYLASKPFEELLDDDTKTDKKTEDYFRNEQNLREAE
tara:strand:- start:44 stop:235 length:192 start_codon:yes stop_codon:yes gene_type:complete